MGIKNRGTPLIERRAPIEILIKCAELLCGRELLRGFKNGFLSLACLDSPFNEPCTLFNQLVQSGLVVIALAVIHQEGCDAVECELGNQAYKLWTNHRKSGGGIVDGVETLDGES